MGEGERGGGRDRERGGGNVPVSVCLAEPTGMEWLCVYTDISLYSLQAIVGGKTTLGEGGEQRVGGGGWGWRRWRSEGREGRGGGRRRSNQYLIVTECPRLVIFMASPGIIDGVWVNRRWGERRGKGREREGGRWGTAVGRGAQREVGRQAWDHSGGICCGINVYV